MPRLLCVVVVLAAAAPALGDTARQAVGCGGPLPSHGSVSCSTSVWVAHFNRRDRIDYTTLVARVISPQALSWRVSGSIADARGVVYFTWACTASRSSVAFGNQTHVEESCGARRKSVLVRRDGRTYRAYYVADTSKPQRVRVEAEVGMCAPSCRFEGAAEYVLAG